MGEWRCDDCDGEFPEPYVAHGAAVCPWCGQRLAKMFTASDAQQRRLQRYYSIGESGEEVSAE